MITFVVPAYNAESTLRRTLDSILHQTSDHYHIVIVNDGSKDTTDRICREYEKNYSEKIIYISQENRGLGGARNHGMEFVKTQYVSFLDSDDWLMPEYVENFEKAVADNNPEMILMLPRIYHEGSKVVRDWYDKKIFDEIFPVDGAIVNPANEMKIYQFEVNQCRKVLNMDFVRRVDFTFREKIKWEDVVPHFYLLSQCTECMGIGSVGFYYRIGGTGQITAARGNDRLDFLQVMEDLIDYIEASGHEELRFPAMRVIVRFAIWGIRMSDIATRKKLVKSFYKQFKKIPRVYFRELKKGTRKNYSKKDALQYRLFLISMRYKLFNFIYYDYLLQDVGEKTVKKILKAGPRVA